MVVQSLLSEQVGDRSISIAGLAESGRKFLNSWDIETHKRSPLSQVARPGMRTETQATQPAGYRSKRSTLYTNPTDPASIINVSSV
ncbi:MAG: hypothetical protein ACM37W_15255 [Actinomycetota bacterium]